MAATNAALAAGGITQYSFRCGLISFFLSAAYRVEVRRGYDLALDDRVGKQTERPMGVALSERRAGLPVHFRAAVL
jgi:hypothetical protein